MADPEQNAPSTICIALHRKDLVELTARWRVGQDPTITQWENPPDDDLNFSATIVCKGLQVGAFPIKLGKTTYLRGDATFRYYKNAMGISRLDLQPTAIRDVDAVTRDFREHIRTYTPEFLRNQGVFGQEFVRICMEFDQDADTFQNLAAQYSYMRMWMVGSMTLKGDDSALQGFGISKVPEDAETLGGCYVPSRIVVSQMQVVVIRELESMAQELSEGFSQLLNSPEVKDKHCLYVFLRMVAEGNTAITSDRHRHGRENGQDGPSLPETVPKIERNLETLFSCLQSRCISMNPRMYWDISVSAKEFHDILLQDGGTAFESLRKQI